MNTTLNSLAEMFNKGGVKKEEDPRYMHSEFEELYCIANIHFIHTGKWHQFTSNSYQREIPMLMDGQYYIEVLFT